MYFYGDSASVVGQLNRSVSSSDMFLYNCAELCKDVLSDWSVSVRWIPREQNSVCDSLAK